MFILSFSTLFVCFIVILLILWIISLWDSAPPHSSMLPLRKMPFFQSAVRWHTNFTFSCIISLWDSVLAHSPSGKELNFSLWKMPLFQGVAPWHTVFTLSCAFSLWVSHQLTHPPVKNSTLPLKKISVSQGVLLDTIFLYYPGLTLWFGTHPFYSLILCCLVC